MTSIFYFAQAAVKGLWGELSGWFSAEIELCVIGIAVDAETVVANDLTKWEHVDARSSGQPQCSAGLLAPHG